jgi:predicted nucleic acid-binding protein
MRIVVSDSSCIIDLRKANLLESFLRLPYEVLIPNTLFEDELLKFTPEQKHAMLSAGLRVVDIPGPGVVRAQQIARESPRLSINDGFAFVVAESHDGSVLVTGDGLLRALATRHGIEVHGVLWIVEELRRHNVENAASLVAALQILEADDAVRLPRRELLAAIKRLSSEGA